MRLSEDKQLLVVKLYNEGMNVRDVAMKLSLTYYSTLRALHKNNVVLRDKGSPRIPDKEVEDIKRRIKHGETITKIADERGVTKSAISNLLTRRRK